MTDLSRRSLLGGLMAALAVPITVRADLLSSASLAQSFFSVKDYGAVGDGITIMGSASDCPVVYVTRYNPSR